MSNRDSEDKLEVIFSARADLRREDIEKEIKILSETTTMSRDDWIDVCYYAVLGDRQMSWEKKEIKSDCKMM